MQRFLSLPQFQIEKLWFPIVQRLIELEYDPTDMIYLVIDRSRWRIE
ncbi:MAG: hypothetical protein SAJ12_14165 [Jaaginema sp. PMC 1079.18]|nr:hypothetical protein [Jaaginema sp. PMC 1079.18]MEC4867652.1 hypothetical protein [Jaaginema sp. PMC 1078.18]